jgi:hypothetical protein
MKEPERDPIASPEDPNIERRPYEPPRIVWREDFQPVSFGVSCAKQPGNPPCVSFLKA